MSRTNHRNKYDPQMPLPLLGIVRASRQVIRPDGTYERIDLAWRTTEEEDAAGDVSAQFARLAATGTDDAVDTTEPYQLPKEGE